MAHSEGVIGEGSVKGLFTKTALVEKQTPDGPH